MQLMPFFRVILMKQILTMDGGGHEEDGSVSAFTFVER